MTIFNINDPKFTDYAIKEVPIDVLVTEAKHFNQAYGKEKVKYLNELFLINHPNLKSFKGVYIFVINSENDVVLTDDFFDDTYVYKKINECKYNYIGTIASSFRSNPKRKPGDGEVTLENKMVFYCGRSDDIFSRTREHLISNNYSGTMSLKLGFEKRKWILDYLKCYVILIDENKRADIEKYIRDKYNSYFGDY